MNQYVAAFFIGAIVAVIIIVGMKLITGKMVRKLLEVRADSAETAKTIEELGFEKNKILNFCLRMNAGKMVMMHDENGKYWIPEEKAEKAGALYNNSSLSFITVFLMLAMLIIIMFIVDYFGREVLKIFD